MLKIVRRATIVMVVGLLVLMLGPFQGIEEGSGVPDKLAHVCAFAVIAVSLLLNFPRLSRVSVAGVTLALAILVEVIQAAVGRDAELADVWAGGLGVAIVILVWYRRKLV
jgi:VanZ family protein